MDDSTVRRVLRDIKKRADEHEDGECDDNTCVHCAFNGGLDAAYRVVDTAASETPAHISGVGDSRDTQRLDILADLGTSLHATTRDGTVRETYTSEHPETHGLDRDGLRVWLDGLAEDAGEEVR